MINNIQISLAEPQDVLGIQQVFYKTWLSTYPNEEHGITVDDIEDRYKDSFKDEVLKNRLEDIKNPKPGNILLVAKDENRVVGVCRLIESKTENRLQAIYVLPEYQKKGIGGMFWKKSQKYINMNKDIYVSVAVYNINAIGFYKKLGFVDTGKRFVNEKFRMKSGSVIPEMELVLRR